MSQVRLCLLHTLVSIIMLATSTSAQKLPPYQPNPATPPADAPYVLPDGSIYIVAGAGMEPILKQFNELFVKTHPGFKFKMLIKGGAATAPGGITAGVSAFALMDRDAWPQELRPFRQVYGYEPTAIRIGHAGYCASGRSCPPGIYINVRNPLAGLTTEQVARIFTAGGGQGDLTHWSQLGLKGEWATRAIHVYGPRDNGGWASAMRDGRMGGFPFTRRYEPLTDDAEIIKALAEDPYGIALVGSYEAKALPSAVKLLPLAEKEGAAYAAASYDDVLAGNYPFSPFLHLYVNRAPGKPLDPFVKEYARLVLSPEGQAIVADQKNSDSGYLPLTAREISTQLSKLE